MKDGYEKSSGETTPGTGCEQISKISSGTGSGPIKTPLDKGHVAGKGK